MKLKFLDKAQVNTTNVLEMHLRNSSNYAYFYSIQSVTSIS